MPLPANPLPGEAEEEGTQGNCLRDRGLVVVILMAIGVVATSVATGGVVGLAATAVVAVLAATGVVAGSAGIVVVAGSAVIGLALNGGGGW